MLKSERSDFRRWLYVFFFWFPFPTLTLKWLIYSNLICTTLFHKSGNPPPTTLLGPPTTLLGWLYLWTVFFFAEGRLDFWLRPTQSGASTHLQIYSDIVQRSTAHSWMCHHHTRLSWKVKINSGPLARVGREGRPPRAKVCRGAKYLNWAFTLVAVIVQWKKIIQWMSKIQTIFVFG